MFAVDSPRFKAAIIFVGPLAPPCTGRILATERMREVLSQHFSIVALANIAPPDVSRRLLRHAGRFVRLLKAFIVLLVGRSRGARLSYQVVDGDLGMFHTVLCVLLSRMVGLHCVLHHHNWVYCGRRVLRMRLLVRAAGRDSIHVTLCAGMSEQIRRHYGLWVRCLPVSNASLVVDQHDALSRSCHPVGGLRLGHLSNLSIEKGLGRVVDTFELLQDRLAAAVTLDLAGPIEGAVERMLVATLTERRGETVKLWGRVAGDQKRQFFGSIDLFLFPSRYRNEAEPLVVLEALSAGVPVLAYSIGCCSDLVGGLGWLVPSTEAFPEAAAQKALVMQAEDFGDARRMARQQFLALKQTADRQLQHLIGAMSALGAPDGPGQT